MPNDPNQNWFQRMRSQVVNNPDPNSDAAQKRQLVAAAGAAGNFAGQGEQGYGNMTGGAGLGGNATVGVSADSASARS